MAYECSFSPDFWLGEGEPYDVEPNVQRPTSVWSAIFAMSDSDWSAMLETFFPLVDKRFYFPRTDSLALEVLDMAQKTNTCSNLNSPVEVWIDPKGDFRVKVYDNVL